MNDERTLKIFTQSQLHNGSHKVGRHLLKYKYKLKQNLNCINIPLLSSEEVASDYIMLCM